MMKIILFLTISTVLGVSRGPHHPRGETIVKHHVHYRPTRSLSPEKLTQDEQLIHDTSHIQEHLEGVVESPDLSNMTEDELDFYYFKIHDTDNNSKLDGLEILQAFYHTTHSFEYGQDASTNSNDDFDYFVEIIDQALAEDDTNNDGYLSYAEYIIGRKKDIQTELPVFVESSVEV